LIVLCVQRRACGHADPVLPISGPPDRAGFGPTLRKLAQRSNAVFRQREHRGSASHTDQELTLQKRVTQAVVGQDQVDVGVVADPVVLRAHDRAHADVTHDRASADRHEQEVAALGRALAIVDKVDAPQRSRAQIRRRIPRKPACFPERAGRIGGGRDHRVLDAIPERRVRATQADHAVRTDDRTVDEIDVELAIVQRCLRGRAAA
jgi:hypothetical protein